MFQDTVLEFAWNEEIKPQKPQVR